MQDYKKLLNDLLLEMAQKNGSDLHISPGYYPTIRVDGRLMPLTNKSVLDSQTLKNMAYASMNEFQKKRFETEKEVDFSYQPDGNARFRSNFYLTRGKVAGAFRLIPEQIKTVEELNMPPIIKIFSKLSQGFVLIVGPNGHGKTTTMAALINEINKERAEKIVTIEDPIEYVFSAEKSIIDQRELGGDTLSFSKALRSTFRENVNVIMVGEMRDYETMSAAVTAAETGHLVFGTLHTNNAAQTIERIVDTFPPSQQQQVIAQLANTLSGIVSQRLVPRIRGGLVPATEILIANPAVRTLIRERKFQQLNLVIDTSFEAGMSSLNRNLAKLVREKEISQEQAEFFSLNQDELRELIKDR